MTVPEGFTVTLAAAEPDVVQPIAFAIDDRGRLWVAEAYTYPMRAPEGEGQDRILIFEDTDGDGTLDKRKVFIEKLNLVSGIEVGFGGVWVGAAPYLLFIPDEGRRRQARPGRRRSCSTAGATRTRTRRSTRSSGDPTAGSTAATASSRTRTSASPARPTPSARRSTPASGAIIRRGTSSKSSPTARATPGASTSTTTARPSSTACVIPHLYHIIPGRALPAAGGQALQPATPTTTSRPSPTTVTTSATRARTPATAAPTPPAAATPTPAR